MRKQVEKTAQFFVLIAIVLLPAALCAELTPEIRKSLAESKYVYIASTRKDGSFSKPAEIWFLFHNDAVYVGSPPNTWRAKRIRWGRSTAKIAVGRPDGPSFLAVGSIVKEPETEKRMIEEYAKKYPGGWPRLEESFRKGLMDGGRVLIKYTAK